MAERRMLLIKKTSNIPPDNEIWYTSTDGNIIDVDAEYTDNELLSNTYEDKGILVFEKSIENITSLFRDKTQLTEVWLPNYNISNTASAFNNCTNLIAVNNSKQLKHIEYYTFANCINLQQIEIDSNHIAYAFENCTSLNFVKISKRIETTEAGIFFNCTSLESINYEGTIEEWNNIINMDPDWRDGSVIKTIHCVDGDIQL